MLRQIAVALVMVVLCFSFVAADTIKGKLTKIDEKSVTVVPGKDKEGKEFKLTKDTKFFSATKDAKEEIKDGAKAEIFSKLPEKGLNVTLTTNDKNEVTEVVVGGKKKKTK